MPRDADVDRPRARRALQAALVLALALSLSVAVWMSCGALVDSLRASIGGPPAFASLRTVDGRLAAHDGCRQPRRGGAPHDAIAVDTGAARVRVDIPCVIPDSEYVRAAAAPVAVRLDDRPFAGHRVYEIVLDGRPLLGYAAVAQARQAGIFPELVTNSIVPLIFLILLARHGAAVWRGRR